MFVKLLFYKDSYRSKNLALCRKGLYKHTILGHKVNTQTQNNNLWITNNCPVQDSNLHQSVWWQRQGDCLNDRPMCSQNHLNCLYRKQYIGTLIWNLNDMMLKYQVQINEMDWYHRIINVNVFVVHKHNWHFNRFFNSLYTYMNNET